MYSYPLLNSVTTQLFIMLLEPWENSEGTVLDPRQGMFSDNALYIDPKQWQAFTMLASPFPLPQAVIHSGLQFHGILPSVCGRRSQED